MNQSPADPHRKLEERARLGPKAAEDEQPVLGKTRGLTLRAMAPNAITAAALCSGLTGIRFAISGQWAAAAVARRIVFIFLLSLAVCTRMGVRGGALLSG